VRRDQPRADGRGEPRGDEGRGAGDESVEDDRDPGGGAPEDEPGERRDLEAADGGEHPDRVGWVRTIRP
jgi:hypothetical protein